MKKTYEVESFGGKVQKEFDLSEADLAAIDLWLALPNDENRPLIQDALPFLSPNDREFFISGLTGEEFDELFAEDADSEMTEEEALFYLYGGDT